MQIFDIAEALRITPILPPYYVAIQYGHGFTPYFSRQNSS
jgi:hypothetical protein